MSRCADCKITFENEAYKYCPLCGKFLESNTNKQITYPWLPSPPFDQPTAPIPIWTYPQTSPITVIRYTTTCNSSEWFKP